MRRRTRWIAGLLALAAMTFSLTETVMAAACDSDMGGHAAMDMVAEHDHGGAATEHAAHTGSTHGSHSDPDETGDDHCPFGDAAFQLCGGIVSLPSSSATAAVPVAHRLFAGFSEPSERPLLLSTALFHPPRL